MTRAISIAIFAVTIAAAVLVGRWRGAKTPSAEELLGHVMRTRTGRLCSIAFWIWVGWHFFAR
jgi:hypothetical protein